MLKIETKQVRQIVQATFPNYKKRSVYVCPVESVTLHDLNWSGGTRKEYRACTISGETAPNTYAEAMHIPAPWNNPYEGLKVELPVGHCIVSGGYFCGKTATLYIYVHPENMPKLLN